MLLQKTWHTMAQDSARLGRLVVALGLICLSAGVVGCGHHPLPPLGALRINEVMSANDGANVDEIGETDDWIELRNASDQAISLEDFVISDKQGAVVTLPDVELRPGERVVLWADDDPSQGELHLPFKLSASGDELFVRDFKGHLSDHVVIPPLSSNYSYARVPEGEREYVVCRYATPGRDNGARCGPQPPPDLVDNIVFEDFTWPDPAPHQPTLVSISELALNPASFIELTNVSDGDVTLSELMLRVATHKPGDPWPDATAGVEVPLGTGAGASTLATGEAFALDVTAAMVSALAADPLFEGVVTLFRRDDQSVVDRVDFMSWPQGALLSRQPDARGHHAFCAVPTRGAPNTECQPLASRALADRDRHFYTPGDFGALAASGTAVGISGVKFVVDRQAGNVVHLLGTEAFDLHYRFVSEVIDQQPHLDRCDADQRVQFNQGWGAFHDVQTDETEGTRRYFLGTFDRYASGGQHTVHFATGDRIQSVHMKEAFFHVMGRVPEPALWAMHPQSQSQAVTMREVSGEVPILGMNAPFRGQTMQPLTAALGFGVLTFIPAAELEGAALGPEVIVVTDDVPNDIALVGGLITEAFQTPLAHVNLLSRNRNTPNLALKEARTDARLESLFEKLVRFEVTSEGFEIREAEAAEAQAFWESRRPAGPRIAPRLDTSVRGVQPLSGHDVRSLPSIGAKAAQLAQLARVAGGRIAFVNPSNQVVESATCSGLVPTPPNAFAIPLVHSIEHLEASGALAIFVAGAEALRDPLRRSAVLEQMRAAILAHPVDKTLLAQVHAQISQHFGTARVRLRSSSNTEDLPEFNGAGLYTSVSVAIGDPERDIQDGIRTVWASLWSRRAFDEREMGNIDQSRVAMAILVHEAFRAERANGVGISRNILDPGRADERYFNFQVGEAAVTNPAPGVTTEQVIHTPWAVAAVGVPELTTLARSSLTSSSVMSVAEIRQINCVLTSIHNAFRRVLDPQRQTQWFAMDIELKLLGDDRELMVKQARPYSFGNSDIPAGCRDFGN